MAIPWIFRRPSGIATPVCVLARNDMIYMKKARYRSAGLFAVGVSRNTAMMHTMAGTPQMKLFRNR